MSGSCRVKVQITQCVAALQGRLCRALVHVAVNATPSFVILLLFKDPGTPCISSKTPCIACSHLQHLRLRTLVRLVVCCNRLASKFVPVEEAETAIARANGAPVLTAATAPHANGLDPSTAQVGICCMPLIQTYKRNMLSNLVFT